ncbi:MAG: hypothetical protein LC655_06175, partial [Bacteroidales bacterium]|nr:hypothetical protein [Bacteroidales bacterium]
SQLESYTKYEHELKQLAHAAAVFWNQRAKKRGAFEEYYPWEQGYPPLAFSSLAMAKLALDEVIHPDEIAEGLKKAAKQLQRRFESQAGNQQMAGLAALAVIRKITPELVKEEKYFFLKKQTLALQDKEGWYTEYDGPDLGYLSVTLDCLWDLYDVTGDTDYLVSAEKALGFMHGFVARRFEGAGMHNARNTDYIVPYGICRFLGHEDAKTREKSETIVASLLNRMEDEDHFFHAIDDRYWSHYIGHSVVRAELFLEEKINPKTFGGAEKDGKSAVNAGDKAEKVGKAGYIFRDLQNSNKHILITAKKGGVFSLYNQTGTLMSDYGWVAISGKKQYVNHWWSKEWDVQEEESSVVISGSMFPHKEKVSTPFLHFGLRVVSFVFGSALTRLLRNVLIFKSGSSGIHFRRRIDLSADSVIVTDTIEGISKKVMLVKAPRASKRHVASADSWHREDLALEKMAEPMETIVRDDNSVVITRIINLP